MCALAYSTVFHGLLTLCAPALGQLVHMGEHAHLTIIVIALVSLGHGGATLRFLLSVSAVLLCVLPTYSRAADIQPSVARTSGRYGRRCAGVATTRGPARHLPAHYGVACRRALCATSLREWRA